MTLELKAKSLYYNMDDEGNPGLGYSLIHQSDLEEREEFFKISEKILVRYVKLYNRVVNGQRTGKEFQTEIKAQFRKYLEESDLDDFKTFRYEMYHIGKENGEYKTKPASNDLIVSFSPNYSRIAFNQRGNSLENRIVKHVVEKELELNDLL